MSRLWRDDLSVALAPDRIALVRTSGGPASRVVAKSILPVPRENGDGWGPALAVLSQALRTRREFRNARLKLVLSNAFVRYLLVPWSDAIESDEERDAYVRESFVDIHGDLALGWTYCTSATGNDAPWLAGAVDSALLEQVEEAADAADSTLVSLQPHLMPAFNASRRMVGEGDFWFAQPDDDRLLLALVVGGRWTAIGNRRLGGASWTEELPRLIEREWSLHGTGAAPRVVYLAAPQEPAARRVGDDQRELRWLRPRLGHALPEQDVAAYAMALGG